MAAERGRQRKKGPFRAVLLLLLLHSEADWGPTCAFSKASSAVLRPFKDSTAVFDAKAGSSLWPLLQQIETTQQVQYLSQSSKFRGSFEAGQGATVAMETLQRSSATGIPGATSAATTTGTTQGTATTTGWTAANTKRNDSFVRAAPLVTFWLDSERLNLLGTAGNNENVSVVATSAVLSVRLDAEVLAWFTSSDGQNATRILLDAAAANCSTEIVVRAALMRAERQAWTEFGDGGEQAPGLGISSWAAEAEAGGTYNLSAVSPPLSLNFSAQRAIFAANATGLSSSVNRTVEIEIGDLAQFALLDGRRELGLVLSLEFADGTTTVAAGSLPCGAAAAVPANVTAFAHAAATLRSREWRPSSDDSAPRLALALSLCRLDSNLSAMPGVPACPPPLPSPPAPPTTGTPVSPPPAGTSAPSSAPPVEDGSSSSLVDFQQIWERLRTWEVIATVCAAALLCAILCCIGGCVFFFLARKQREKGGRKEKYDPYASQSDNDSMLDEMASRLGPLSPGFNSPNRFNSLDSPRRHVAPPSVTTRMAGALESDDENTFSSFSETWSDSDTAIEAAADNAYLRDLKKRASERSVGSKVSLGALAARGGEATDATSCDDHSSHVSSPSTSSMLSSWSDGGGDVGGPTSASPYQTPPPYRPPLPAVSSEQILSKSSAMHALSPGAIRMASPGNQGPRGGSWGARSKSGSLGRHVSLPGIPHAHDPTDESSNSSSRSFFSSSSGGGEFGRAVDPLVESALNDLYAIQEAIDVPAMEESSSSTKAKAQQRSPEVLSAAESPRSTRLPMTLGEKIPSHAHFKGTNDTGGVAGNSPSSTTTTPSPPHHKEAGDSNSGQELKFSRRLLGETEGANQSRARASRPGPSGGTRGSARSREYAKRLSSQLDTSTTRSTATTTPTTKPKTATESSTSRRRPRRKTGGDGDRKKAKKGKKHRTTNASSRRPWQPPPAAKLPPGSHNKSGLCRADPETVDQPAAYQRRKWRNTPVVKPSARIDIGYAETRGRRDAMEDTMVIQGGFRGRHDEELLCVFDGHGGSVVARDCAQIFPTVFQTMIHEDPADVHGALQRAFEGTHQRIFDASLNLPRGGATALVAYLRGSLLWVANAGDTRAIMGVGKTAVRLSVDHKPELDAERQRVYDRGGAVTSVTDPEDGTITHRVNGVLAVSRAIGDFPLNPFVVPTPHVVGPIQCDNHAIVVAEDGKAAAAESALSGGATNDFSAQGLHGVSGKPFPRVGWLVMACDGVWDELSDADAVRLLDGCENPQEAAVALRDEAFTRGSEDNISVLAVDLSVLSKSEQP